MVTDAGVGNAIPGKDIRLLILADTGSVPERRVRQLNRAGLVCQHRTVSPREDYLGDLRLFAPHVILSDCCRPGFGGLEALKLAQKQRPAAPFMLVSSVMGGGDGC